MEHDEKYWKKREEKTLNESLEILTEDFGIYVSLADYSFIKKYVREYIDMWKKVPREQRVNLPVNLAAEAAGKFMMNFCGFQDIYKMNRAIYNGRKL